MFRPLWHSCAKSDLYEQTKSQADEQADREERSAKPGAERQQPKDEL